ncbi:NRDE family protein [OM182 bacterium]|nr:NRDE family protein [OM182 bacterium]
MCIVILQFKPTGSHPLILSANRDEYFSRPSAMGHVWKENSIIAGKDLQGGGTWLGTTFSGRFAAITNFPAYKQLLSAQTVSRGTLVTEFLSGLLSPEDYASKVSKDKENYEGFNLIIGDRQSLFYITNARPEVEELKPGIYSLSNHFLDYTCRRSLNAAIKFSQIPKPNITTDLLIDTMQDNSELEDSNPVLQTNSCNQEDSGIPSSIFMKATSIKNKGAASHYGTVSTTALIIRKNGDITFCEDRYKKNGKTKDRSMVKIENSGSTKINF